MDVSVSLGSRLEVTVDYLLFLHDSGCSGLVASLHLYGVPFYFKLLGWEDMTKAFLVT